jgi:hypothetical protein
VGEAGDRGRGEVYAAELVAFEGTELEAVESFDAVCEFVQSVVAGTWWPAGPVEVRRARQGARTSTTRVGGASPGPEIRLSRPQCTRATAVHELAHVLAGPSAGHGPVFRCAHVDIATVAFGDERAGWLAEAYSAARLPLGARSWPEPSAGGPGHVIAL